VANVSAGSSIDAVSRIEQRPCRVKHVADRGLEQLLLAVEVVVERTHADVGGLGDLEYRHVEFAFGDQPLAALTRAALVRCLRRSRRLEGSDFVTPAVCITFEDFVISLD